MVKLVFATNNPHKLKEIQTALATSGAAVEVIGLADLGCREDIPETADTLQGNALQKVMYLHEKYAIDGFADDTGLEVEALNGGPGVYSARYAGEGCSFDDNIDKLLREMDGITNRKGVFRTVICLLSGGVTHYFEGYMEGKILTGRRGTGGFGYDPVFQPDNSEHTFAEMDLEEKNRLSHRGQAIRLLVEHLQGKGYKTEGTSEVKRN